MQQKTITIKDLGKIKMISVIADGKTVISTLPNASFDTKIEFSITQDLPGAQ